jgi:hypothetical protein
MGSMVSHPFAVRLRMDGARGILGNDEKEQPQVLRLRPGPPGLRSG